MKKRSALFLFVLFLAACSNEIEETEATASETTLPKEQVDTEVASEAPEIEVEEPVLVEATEVEEIEEVIEEPVEVDEEPIEEPEESIYTPGSGTITAEEIKALVPDYFGPSEVAALEVNGGDIYVAVDMDAGDLFTPADMAITRYSQLSDELLYYEGWDSLTVEFIGIGTIDMHISEAESNEYGDYFPTLAIEENLYY